MVKNLIWSKVVLVWGIGMLLLVWGLIIAGIFLKSETDGKKIIEKLIPEGAILRDYTKLNGEKSEKWLAIYIEKGYIEEELVPGSLMSCPGEITGQPIRGRYHVMYVNKNAVVNDLPIPNANYEIENYKLPLVYRNLNEAGGIDIKHLLNMKDYTGDGIANEFLLMTTEGGCGFWDGLVAGYDSETDKAVIYSGWIPRLSPDNRGKFHYLFECGDHGNDIKVESDYVFDKNSKLFIKQAEKKTSCSV